MNGNLLSVLPVLSETDRWWIGRVMTGVSLRKYEPFDIAFYERVAVVKALKNHFKGFDSNLWTDDLLDKIANG